MLLLRKCNVNIIPCLEHRSVFDHADCWPHVLLNTDGKVSISDSLRSNWSQCSFYQVFNGVFGCKWINCVICKISSRWIVWSSVSVWQLVKDCIGDPFSLSFCSEKLSILSYLSGRVPWIPRNSNLEIFHNSSIWCEWC